MLLIIIKMLQRPSTFIGNGFIMEIFLNCQYTRDILLEVKTQFDTVEFDFLQSGPQSKSTHGHTR